jgi:hypothetical protein
MTQVLDAHGGQKRAPDPLELELKAIVSFLMWVLRTELWSSRRAVYVLTWEPFFFQHKTTFLLSCCWGCMLVQLTITATSQPRTVGFVVSRSPLHHRARATRGGRTREFDCAYPKLGPGGCPAMGSHRIPLWGGEGAQSKALGTVGAGSGVPRPTWRPGPSAPQALGHPGAAGCRGRAEN